MSWGEPRHDHVCYRCWTRWSHGESCGGSAPDHACPGCGRYQFWRTSATVSIRRRMTELYFGPMSEQTIERITALELRSVRFQERVIGILRADHGLSWDALSSIRPAIADAFETEDHVTNAAMEDVLIGEDRPFRELLSRRLPKLAAIGERVARGEF